MRSLRAQPCDAPTDGLALGHWRHRGHGRIRAGLLDDACGHLASPVPVPVRAGDDRGNGRIGSSRRPQGVPAVGCPAFIPTPGSIDIEPGGAVQQLLVVCGLDVQRRWETTLAAAVE